MSRRIVVHLGIAALLLVACHASQSVAGSSTEIQGVILVSVVNRNRIDVMVYVSHDGINSRLGLATAATSTDFVVPLRMLGAGREYRLVGHPVGLRIAVTTEILHAQSGDEVTWSLEDSFARSTVVVH